MINRHAISYLETWQIRPNRKPLIIRGARQVGKTTLVQSFGSSFEQFLQFNLDLESDRLLFDLSKDIRSLVQSLFLSRQLTLKSGSLLFIDEIQESPKAMQFLRYFREEYPTLYVIAAGSLLDHALPSVASFPVGRVEYLTLYPLNFGEFLSGMGYHESLRSIHELPIAPHAHQTLLKQFHEFAMVGGMPEVVSLYSQTRDMTSLQPIYESLMEGYFNDVDRYASNAREAQVIRHVIQNATLFAETRIAFQNFAGSNYRSREVSEAMRSLQKARLLYLVYPTAETIPPPLLDKKKRPRLEFLDTGLIVHNLSLYSEMLSLSDLNESMRGRIAQHLVGQELQSSHYQPRYQNLFWTREREGDAEIDFLVQHLSHLIPVEVKSGATGRLRSMFEFIDRCPHGMGMRLYAGPYLVQKLKTIKGKEFTLMNLPYYLAFILHEYLPLLVEAHTD